ncbi:MAG: hypothetical protein ACRDL5_04975 [Solirubrobacteraceae bacterium]
MSRLETAGAVIRTRRRLRGDSSCAGVPGPGVATGAGSGPARTVSGGEPTLDALLSGVWEGLAAHAHVGCPLCEGEMRPLYGAHHLPIGGVCQSCGTRIS